MLSYWTIPNSMRMTAGIVKNSEIVRQEPFAMNFYKQQWVELTDVTEKQHKMTGNSC